MISKKDMTAKVHRMMRVLNSNGEGRKYVVQNIDFADSGYLRISDCFDVEINPCLTESDIATLFLWRLRGTDGQYCYDIACARGVAFADLDGIVKTWMSEITERKMVSHAKDGLSLKEIYD